ncbi:G-type lectin S-receptor serine/threonine-protein kinase [Salix suchowensis]|nr:G-type lectin S-receptor serine/threonine-protein kinase [Salix suchowensis]
MDSEFAYSFLLLYFVVSLRSVICQTSGTVNVGESLAATGQNPPWLSPSKDFAFGFRQINENDDFFLLATVPVTDYYHKATLNFDGVFTISHHPKNSLSNETWTVIETKPKNICLELNGPRGSGICGFNNVCKLKDDQRPTCECPPGYSLIDPEDKYGSCKPDFIRGCEVDGQIPQEDLYKLVELPNTDWPPSDYELTSPCSQEECRKSCQQDCFCAAAVSKDGRCWKKKLPLSNGRKDIVVSSMAFLKVRKDNSTLQNTLCRPPIAEKNQDSLIIVVSVLLGGSVIVIFILAGLLCSGSFLHHRKHTESHQQESSMGMNLRCLTYKELEDATNGLNEELGRGSFGIVYKGPQNILLDGSYNARISDFGLAKLLMINQTHTKTNIRGTKGYVAPEWFRSNTITAKVDAYSFGVMLLEIISCRRSVEIEIRENDREILTDWAYLCIRRGTLDALADEDPEVTSDMKRLERYVMIALWCIQEDPSLRPTMKKVMLMLEGNVQVAIPPSPCPLSSTIR